MKGGCAGGEEGEESMANLIKQSNSSLVSKLAKKCSYRARTTLQPVHSLRWTNIAAAFNAEELCNLLERARNTLSKTAFYCSINTNS